MAADSTKRKVLAVFDFDGTLSPRDTSVSFLAFASGRTRVLTAFGTRSPLFLFDLMRAVRMERADPTSALGSVRGRWGTLVHRRLLRALLRGRERSEIEDTGRRFAEELNETDLSREGLEQLDWHHGEGHECLVVTASLEAYMGPWGASAGFDGVLATRLAFDGRGRATGEFEKAPCWGEEKLRRLHTEVGPLEGRTLVVYGDGRGDRALMARADHAVLVRGRDSWRVGGAEVRRRLGPG